MIKNYKLLFSFLLTLPFTVFAGAEGAPHLDGQNLAIFWVLPFVGILLSIAIFPLVAEHFWHHNFGKISLFWALLLIIPFTISQGIQITLYELLHVGLLEYVPFLYCFFHFIQFLVEFN